MWLKHLFIDLKVEVEGPIEILCDNQSIIAIAKNLVHHDRTKHVDIDRHFISEKIENNVITMKHVPSKRQLADILTKALHRLNFHELSSKLEMSNISTSSWRGSVENQAKQI